MFIYLGLRGDLVEFFAFLAGSSLLIYVCWAVLGRRTEPVKNWRGEVWFASSACLEEA